MSLWIALLTAVGGYLIGSISFARIIMSIGAPGETHESVRRAVPGSDDVFEAHSVSATAVRIRLGSRYGCLTSLLDAAKAALPSLILRAWQPDQPYHLIAATTAIVGHIYPLYYGFRGGRGLSTVYGGLLVVDWLGTLATTAAGMAVGILAEQVLLIRWAGLILMIPWVWIRWNDLGKLAFVLAANLLFWTAMIPELRQYFRLQAQDKIPDSAEVADLLGMRTMWQVARRYSIRQLLARRRRGRPT